MSEPSGQPTDTTSPMDDRPPNDRASDDRPPSERPLDDQILNVAVDDRLLACIVRASYRPDRTTFVTDPVAPLQLGFVVRPAGAEIRPHLHDPVERRLRGTPETIIVRSGECEVYIFTRDGLPVATHTLRAGDVIVLLDGGHGFRMRLDTVLLEVKQGPYLGDADKRSLDPPHPADHSNVHGDGSAGAPTRRTDPIP